MTYNEHYRCPDDPSFNVKSIDTLREENKKRYRVVLYYNSSDKVVVVPERTCYINDIIKDAKEYLRTHFIPSLKIEEWDEREGEWCTNPCHSDIGVTTGSWHGGNDTTVHDWFQGDRYTNPFICIDNGKKYLDDDGERIPQELRNGMRELMECAETLQKMYFLLFGSECLSLGEIKKQKCEEAQREIEEQREREEKEKQRLEESSDNAMKLCEMLERMDMTSEQAEQ